VGDRIELVGPGGPRTFTLVGVAGFGRASNLAGATLGIFDLATAQEVMDRVGQFDSIDVRAAEGVSDQTLQDRVAAALPAGYEAVTSDQLTQESNDAVDEGLAFFKTFLLVFAFIALFVGAFIIYNTFAIVVAQRTRELALLRALGATGRQVMASVIGESLVLGVIASAIGLGAGMLLAVGLKALSPTRLRVPSGRWCSCEDRAGGVDRWHAVRRSRRSRRLAWRCRRSRPRERRPPPRRGGRATYSV
jgi:putative ABC transport system permease protein